MKVFCTVVHLLRPGGSSRVQEGGKCALLRERLAFGHTTEVTLDNFGQNSMTIMAVIYVLTYILL